MPTTLMMATMIFTARTCPYCNRMLIALLVYILEFILSHPIIIITIAG